MSIETFDDDCQGCRPALVDAITGYPYPEDSPAMKLANKLWSETPRDIKEAWHRFTCQNSRTQVDMIKAAMFGKALEEAFQK